MINLNLEIGCASKCGSLGPWKQFLWTKYDAHGNGGQSAKFLVAKLFIFLDKLNTDLEYY